MVFGFENRGFLSQKLVDRTMVHVIEWWGWMKIRRGE